MDRILIAYDGSSSSEAAIFDLQRAGLPALGTAEVLSIADFWLPEPSPDMPVATPHPLTPGIEKAYQHARDALIRAQALAERGAAQLGTLFPHWHIHARALAITPAWGIVERAQEWKPDLIVMGSKGHSALERVLIGSVAQTVLTHVPCSVRIGRSNVALPGTPIRVLLGFDGSSGAEHALHAVTKRTWPAGTLVRVATCDNAWFGTSSVAFLPGVAAWARKAHEAGMSHDREILSYAKHQLDAVGINSDGVVLTGDAKSELPEEAARWGADCIFVGARGLNATQRILLGSVSTAISARAQCSVEVVRMSEPDD
jgi:nucleotide-binding universal stress UspA family protein